MRNNDLSPTVQEMLNQHQSPPKHPLQDQRVYICSPYRGDTYGNARWARSYCMVLAHEGIIPVAPHIFYPQFISDAIPAMRKLGLQMALKDLELCQELWAFIPETGPSEGMKGEIALAEELGIKVRIFRFGVSEHELRMAIREMAGEALGRANENIC